MENRIIVTTNSIHLSSNLIVSTGMITSSSAFASTMLHPFHRKSLLKTLTLFQWRVPADKRVFQNPLNGNSLFHQLLLEYAVMTGPRVAFATEIKFGSRLHDSNLAVPGETARWSDSDDQDNSTWPGLQSKATRLEKANNSFSMDFWIRIILVWYITQTRISVQRARSKDTWNAIPLHSGSALLLKVHHHPFAAQLDMDGSHLWHPKVASNGRKWKYKRAEDEVTETPAQNQKKDILTDINPLKRGRWEHRRRCCQDQRRP